VIIYFSMRIGTSILTAGRLCFRPQGSLPSTPKGSVMLSERRDYIGVADHMNIFPGIDIFLTMLFFNLSGDVLHAALDTQLR
jgi:glutathione transport system permease protein